MQAEIDLFQAIAQMRHLSKIGKPFAFKYTSYSATTQQSQGVKTVARAVLRKAHGTDMLNFYNLDTHQNRKCHQLMLMEFNGQKTILQ